MRFVESPDNPAYRQLRRLCQSSRERRKTGLSVLDGMHLLTAYEERFRKVRELFVSEAAQGKPEIAAYLARCPGIKQTVLSERLFEDLGLVDTPTGIVGLIDTPVPAAGPDTLADAVLLDGVQDPGNLGSILRSAAAAGFGQVLLSPDCAQAWAPKTLRAGQGAHFQTAIHENQDLCAFLAGYGGKAAVTALGAEADLFDADLTGPVAWVFGSEGQGVRPAVQALATAPLAIRCLRAWESLNVAAAAAVCLFETVRQRRRT
ncbi:MAG TPA: RNA methyltransferase [Azospira sp.]|nr:RNA methyltransferase [Azospira sp.]